MGARLFWLAVYLVYAAVVLIIGYQLAIDGTRQSFVGAQRTLVTAIVCAITPGLLLLVALVGDQTKPDE